MVKWPKNHWKQISWSWKTYYLDGSITPKPSKHPRRQWSVGLRNFYGDDLSCRSTHKGLMWNLDSPVAIHVDYLVRIILHWSLIYSNTERCSAPASSGRRLNALSPDLGLFLLKQERGQLEGERLPAGWRAVEGEEKGQLVGKPAGARIGEGWKMPYNVLVCIPTNLVCISLFHIFTQFL